MDIKDCIKSRKLFKHLSDEERFEIAFLRRKHYSLNAIAFQLGRSPSTIAREVWNNCKILKNNGHTPCYEAKFAIEFSKDKRKTTGRNYKRLQCSQFISEVEYRFKNNKESIDGAAGALRASGRFTKEECLSTKTLYNYISFGLIGIHNKDLPEKIGRKSRKKHLKEHKKVLGTSIEERDDEILTRSLFGHWELDLVLGKQTSKEVLITLVERKTRYAISEKLKNKKAKTIFRFLKKISKNYGKDFSKVFKTFTTDNGSEFSMLDLFCKKKGIKAYFAHPFSAFEKGTVERYNRLIRRFVKKGTRIEEYTKNDISWIVNWANSLPRKILGYSTPLELFKYELKNLKCA